MNIVAGATAFLLLLTCCEEISAAPFDCDYASYRAKNGKCTKCGKCGLGEEVTENCGHDAKGNQLTHAKPCETCQNDTYQDQQAAYECTPCTSKCPEERPRIKKHCTATSDLVCECELGWYDDKGTCKRCVYCCEDKYNISDFHEPKCANDGMGRCSCRHNKACTQKKCKTATTAPSPSTPVSSDLRKETTQNASPAARVSPTTAQSQENTELATTEAGSIFLPWWIVASVTFAIVLVSLLAILVWRCKKRVSVQLHCDDDSSSTPGTVHIQGPHELVNDREVLNMAKLMKPAENSSEYLNQEIVCSCLSDSTQHADGSKSLSTSSTKIQGETFNEDDTTSGQRLDEIKPLLKMTTESTVRTTGPAKKSTNGRGTPRDVAESEISGDAICTEQDDLDKMQGGVPISDTTYPPQDPQIVLPGCVCRQVIYLTQHEEIERSKRKTNNGHFHKVETNDDCPYRPKTNRTGHSCRECQPQPTDPLWDTLERNCLQEELREKLNQNNDWKKILTFIRQEKSIETLEDKKDSAQGTLNKLRTLKPHLTLGEFFDILKEIERPDLQQVITEHHMKCDLCKKNSFDNASRSSP